MLGYRFGASQKRCHMGSQDLMCDASFVAALRLPSSSGLNDSFDLHVSMKACHSSLSMLDLKVSA